MEDMIHSYQEDSSWCGIACWEMLFKTLRIDILQSDLEKFITDKNWGTSHEDMDRIAHTYFLEFQSKEGWSFEDMGVELEKGHVIILDIWDAEETNPPEPADGHYILVETMDRETRTVKVLDPSRSIRKNGRKHEYEMSFEELGGRWYDFLDEEKTQKTEHWAISVNPQSLKKLV